MSLDLQLVMDTALDPPGEKVELYWTNITHNLTDMAEEAGLYKPLWCPEENGFEKAEDLIPVLEEGINLMEKQPEKFREYNAPNDWGTYDQFLPWLEELLEACKLFKEATIEIDK